MQSGPTSSFISGRAPRRRAVALLALLATTGAVMLAAVAPAGAAVPVPVVVPPVPPLYNVLAVRWWQYAFAQPTTTNPLVDPTGANCAKGQAGPVFFLAGTLGSGTATRDACVTDRSHALFLPLINAFDVHVPGDDLGTLALVYQDFVKNFQVRVDTLFASVDGVPVRGLGPARSPFRACAAPVAGCFPPSFSLTFPADNLFHIDAGTYAPAVQDGFYLLLAPLPPGRHTIRFGGTGHSGVDDTPATQDITYHLTVTR